MTLNDLAALFRSIVIRLTKEGIEPVVCVDGKFYPVIDFTYVHSSDRVYGVEVGTPVLFINKEDSENYYNG